jgi:exodeoxyribonuclease-3
VSGGNAILLHNFYVPAGGDEPDPDINPKFRHKLDFIEEMNTVRAEQGEAHGSILVGDLNIAPLPTDVWSHKQLLNVVSHTPVETEGLEAMRQAGGWVDLMRRHIPPEEKVYTWWSYRARDWELSDRGRRLDHVWSSDNVAASLAGIDILREARGWDRPSDHVPVVARFDLD